MANPSHRASAIGRGEHYLFTISSPKSHASDITKKRSKKPRLPNCLATSVRWTKFAQSRLIYSVTIPVCFSIGRSFVRNHTRFQPRCHSASAKNMFLHCLPITKSQQNSLGSRCSRIGRHRPIGKQMNRYGAVTYLAKKFHWRQSFHLPRIKNPRPYA